MKTKQKKTFGSEAMTGQDLEKPTILNHCPSAVFCEWIKTTDVQARHNHMFETPPYFFLLVECKNEKE